MIELLDIPSVTSKKRIEYSWAKPTIEEKKSVYNKVKYLKIIDLGCQLVFIQINLIQW